MSVTVWVKDEPSVEVTCGDKMELFVPDKKLREALEDFASAKRQYGQDMAKKLHLRRDALLAADSLADFWPPKKKPERVHELVADLKGLFSIDLKQPKRLLFKAMEQTAPPQQPQQQSSEAEKPLAPAAPASEVEPASAGSPDEAAAAKDAPPGDELVRWKTIKKVEIVRVEDTHG